MTSNDSTLADKANEVASRAEAQRVVDQLQGGRIHNAVCHFLERHVERGGTLPPDTLGKRTLCKFTNFILTEVFGLWAKRFFRCRLLRPLVMVAILFYVVVLGGALIMLGWGFIFHTSNALAITGVVAGLISIALSALYWGLRLQEWAHRVLSDRLGDSFAQVFIEPASAKSDDFPIPWYIQALIFLPGVAVLTPFALLYLISILVVLGAEQLPRIGRRLVWLIFRARPWRRGPTPAMLVIMAASLYVVTLNIRHDWRRDGAGNTIATSVLAQMIAWFIVALTLAVVYALVDQRHDHAISKSIGSTLGKAGPVFSSMRGLKDSWLVALFALIGAYIKAMYYGICPYICVPDDIETVAYANATRAD